jgi:GR25 family glycosyltransferase involved in LPS biosynthesis
MKNRTRTHMFQTWNPLWNASEPAGIPEQPSTPKWSGRYINLERSRDRRLHVENEIERHGLKDRYRRFAAIDGKSAYTNSKISAAEKGIFASHLALFKQAAAGTEVLHIIEDDVAFSSALAPFVDWIVDGNAIQDYDMVVTDTFIPIKMSEFRWFVRAYTAVRRGNAPAMANGIALIHMENKYLYGCSSHIVAPAGAARIVEVLNRAWGEEPTAPVDKVLQDAVVAQELRIGCAMPFVTWLDLKLADASTAERPEEVHLTWTLQRLIRHLFFVDCDIQNYLAPALSELIQGNSGRVLTRWESYTMGFAKKVLAACGVVSNKS